MTIFEFMYNHFNDCKEIIDNIFKDQFDSHDFIFIFRDRFRSDYENFLSYYKEDHQIVNQQIGKVLSLIMDEFEIKSIGQQNSLSTNNKISKNELWEKTNKRTFNCKDVTYKILIDYNWNINIIKPNGVIKTIATNTIISTPEKLNGFFENACFKMLL
jgi:hypothetical protein